MIKCKICDKEFGNKGFSSHLKKYNIKSKEYYDKYLKKENEGICQMYGRISSCLKYTKFIKLSKGYSKCCSLRCAKFYNDKKIKQTNIKKYGVENVFQNEEIKEKIKQTNLKKYGVENPAQNKQIYNKVKQTNLEKYGVENPNQNKEIIEKSKKTCLKKYGFENPAQNEEIKEKIKQTNLERYGNITPLSNNKIREIISNNILEKTFLMINKQLKYLDLNFLDDKYLGSKINHNWKCLKCNNKFKQIWNSIQQGYTCPKCYPKNQGYSKGEKELVEFIRILDLDIIENSRKIIKPLELDIYILSKNVAIEFDGLYWHSENFNKDKNYHLNKTEMCEKQNIQLIHIFEDEWVLKQEIIKSRLKQILGVNNSIRIHARKCIIKEISPKVKNKFLEEYHIQGKDNSVIKLGAFYNNELISVMTFSHGSISKGSKNINDIWELNRFCSNLNYHVPGIASKLLSHFKRNYEWKEIFSYADRRWSEGNVYFQLGFELEHITKPNYWYIKNGLRIHRFNLRKKPDEPKDIPEWILRAKEGYHRIYDCGHYKFKIENKIEKLKEIK